jgi:probable rRNA maturation factor
MAKIEITDLQDHVRLDKKIILQVIRRVMKSEGRSAKSLSIVLTDNRHIRDLNREYLGRDGLTDVISFPLEDLDWPPGNRAGAGGGLNGEIIASAELALRQAEASHGDAQAELLLYLVHGLLHLMGYNDRTPQDARRMHVREDALLEECGFTSVYASRQTVQ